jgi:hypothetical protein
VRGDGSVIGTGECLACGNCLLPLAEAAWFAPAGEAD